MRSMFRRMYRAALLDWKIYEEVESDPSATLQALLIILLISLAAALGSSTGFAAIPFSLVAHLLAWFVWAALAYWIGVHLLPEPGTEATLGQLLRTIGFAGTPGLLRILGVFPGIRFFVFWGSAIWMLLAVVIAVRQALDYASTPRAVLVCIFGWLVQVLVLILATTSVG